MFFSLSGETEDWKRIVSLPWLFFQNTGTLHISFVLYENHVSNRVYSAQSVHVEFNFKVLAFLTSEKILKLH